MAAVGGGGGAGYRGGIVCGGVVGGVASAGGVGWNGERRGIERERDGGPRWPRDAVDSGGGARGFDVRAGRRDGAGPTVADGFAQADRVGAGFGDGWADGAGFGSRGAGAGAGDCGGCGGEADGSAGATNCGGVLPRSERLYRRARVEAAAGIYGAAVQAGAVDAAGYVFDQCVHVANADNDVEGEAEPGANQREAGAGAGEGCVCERFAGGSFHCGRGRRGSAEGANVQGSC